MKQVTTLTLKNGDAIIEGAMEKLQAYAAELGLAATTNGRWKVDRAGTYVNFNVQLLVGGASAIDDKEQTDFNRIASYYGLEPQDFGAVIESRGRKFKLFQINTRAPKYPFNFKDVLTDQVMRFPELAKDRIIAARKKAA